MASNVPYYESASPFSLRAREYLLKGWSPIPLPFRQKKSPPSGCTGRLGKFTDNDDIDNWCEVDKWAKGNIAVHPGNPIEIDGKIYEAIAIDVDNYGSKKGAEELAQLEKDLGKLPDTWTCTSKSDGISGHRWYLVDHGFEFRGQASESIEIIQRTHRYGLVFPSFHPQGGQYHWYDRGEKTPSYKIPYVKWLSILPHEWFMFLTRNKMVATAPSPVDMESSAKELYAWAKTEFVDGNKMCKKMEQALKNRLKLIAESANHHDPLVQGHWNLLHLSAEGHPGWLNAVKEMERAWLQRIIAEGSGSNRFLFEAKSEISRSREGVLRKIKGSATEKEVNKNDPCDNRSSESWPTNEDGNAEHFLYLFGTIVRFVANYVESGGTWIVFSKKQQRWVVDKKSVRVRHMFRIVKKRQVSDAMKMLSTADTPAKEKIARSRLAWANDSGNRNRVTNSLFQAQSYELSRPDGTKYDITVDYSELDSNLMLLPVANGIIKFNSKEQRLNGAPPLEWIKSIKEELITLNTDVPYIPFKEQQNHIDPNVRKNFNIFIAHMNTTLKDRLLPEDWNYVTRAIGLSIIGINVKKAIFLVGKPDTGKSTTQNMINAALGDLSIWREPRIFLDTTFKPALAEALIRRVCMVGEIGEKLIDASLFKRITGGEYISCNLKNVNKPINMVPRCTIISGCNGPPVIPDVDEATKSRFIVIPFRHKFEGSDKDERALNDLPEICKVPMLAWLIEGCCNGIMEGIDKIPAGLQLEQKQFVSELSDISDFINEALVLSPKSDWKKYATAADDPRECKPRWPDELCIGDRTLWQCYKIYEHDNQMKPMTRIMFTRKLKNAGLIQDGSWTKFKERRWLGVQFSGKLKNIDY